MAGQRIFGLMAEPHPTQELAGLRQFLERLELGQMRMVLNHVDVTLREIGIVKREIVYLEQVLARLKSGAL